MTDLFQTITIREAWLIAISYMLGGFSLLFTAKLMQLTFRR